MKARTIVALLLVASPLMAQTPPRQPSADQVYQRRYQITQMENALAIAVRHAAETMSRRMQAIAPNLVLMTGTARARGFVLPDYGILFDVEVPGMPMSVAWTLRVMERDLDLERSLQTLRQALQALPEPQRKDVDLALRRLELSVGPIDTTGTPATPAGARDRAGAVAAAAVVPGVPGQVPPAPEAAGRDLNEAYTDVVKNALVDAMLDYSGSMNVRPDEWLTIAARDSYGPVAPGEIYDATTVVLRIKGSDLAAFRADRLTREEARKRVEVREF